MIVANRTQTNENHNNCCLHVCFSSYLNTKYIINICLKWKWKILWLKCSACFFFIRWWFIWRVCYITRWRFNTRLIQSNIFPGIVWMLNEMSLCVWMPIYQRRKVTWAQLPTRRAPNLLWQYQNFIESNSSSKSNSNYR